jgi:hypothetical protein
MRTGLRPAALGVVGLLIITAGTVAAAAPGDPWRLGVANAINAGTSLSGAVATRLVAISNTSTAAGARALSVISRAASSTLYVQNTGTGPGIQIRVGTGRSPITVDTAAGKALNLNADKVDGYNGSQLVGPAAWGNVAGYSTGAPSLLWGSPNVAGVSRPPMGYGPVGYYCISFTQPIPSERLRSAVATTFYGGSARRYPAIVESPNNCPANQLEVAVTDGTTSADGDFTFIVP